MTLAPDLEPIAISVTQAAKLLGISRSYAYQMISQGKMPGAYSIGSRILINLTVLRSESLKRAKAS